METANFLELRSRISEWNIDDEESFLTKLTSFKDTYIQQYNSLSNNLTNLSRNIDLIEIDFYNSMNSLKTISQYKLIEHIIEPDEQLPTALTTNDPENEDEQILTNEQRAALLEQAKQNVIQTSIDAIPKETKQQQAQSDQVEDDTVSVTSSRTLFDGVGCKKVKLPFIIETSDFKDTEFLGLAQEDVVEEKLNENNGIDNRTVSGVTEKEFVPVSADGEEVKFETEGLPKGSIPVPPPLQQNVPLNKQQRGVKAQMGMKTDNDDDDEEEGGSSGLSSMLRSQTKSNHRMTLQNKNVNGSSSSGMQLPDSRQSLPMNMSMKPRSNTNMHKQFVSPNSVMFGGGMGRSTMMNPKGGVSLGNFLSGMDGDDDDEEEEEDNDDNYNHPNMNMNRQMQIPLQQQQQQQQPLIQMNAPHIPVMIKPNQLPMRTQQQLPVRNEDDDDDNNNNNMKQQQQQQPKLPQPKLPSSSSSQGGFFDMNDQQQQQQQHIQQASKSMINQKPKPYMRAQTIQPTPESEKLLKAKKNLSSIFDDDDDDDDNNNKISSHSTIPAKQGRETSIPLSSTASDKFSKITAQTSSLSHKLSLITNESKSEITRNTVSNVVAKKPLKSALFNMDDEEEDDGSADRNPFEKRKPEVKEQQQQQPQKISMFDNNNNKGRSTLPVKKNVFDDDDEEEEKPKQKTMLPKSIFDDEEDNKPKIQVKKEQQQMKTQVKKQMSKNLFDDDDEDDDSKQVVKKKIEEQQQQPKKTALPKSIFDDDEDNNKKAQTKPKATTTTTTNVPKSIFDDNDEDDKPKPKPKPVTTTTAPKKIFDDIDDKPKPKPTTTAPKNLFDDNEENKPKPKPTTTPKKLFDDIDDKPKPQITSAPKAIFDDIDDKPKPVTTTVPNSIFEDNDEDNNKKVQTKPPTTTTATTVPKSIFDDNDEDNKPKPKPTTTTTTAPKNLFDDNEEDKPKPILTTQDKPKPKQNMFDILPKKPEAKITIVSNEQEKPVITQPAPETTTKKLNPFEQMLENQRQEQLKRQQEREKESQLFKQSNFKERFSNMEQVSVNIKHIINYSYLLEDLVHLKEGMRFLLILILESNQLQMKKRNNNNNKMKMKQQKVRKVLM